MSLWNDPRVIKKNRIKTTDQGPRRVYEYIFSSSCYPDFKDRYGEDIKIHISSYSILGWDEKKDKEKLEQDSLFCYMEAYDEKKDEIKERCLIGFKSIKKEWDKYFPNKDKDGRQYETPVWSGCPEKKNSVIFSPISGIIAREDIDREDIDKSMVYFVKNSKKYYDNN